jgi:valyl-tRNA synthetase
MELSKNYIPAPVEAKWTQHWKERGYFNSVPDERKAFTVVIPPPNVTGVLHMGHTLNETVQDILVRNARMNGYNACWVPGSDHASIATEARVVQMLEKEKGIRKADLSREEFLRYAFEWKEKYGNIIYSQIEKLGCSVDWNRVTFTMDDHYYAAVIKVFCDLFKKGMIYRGARMINWDPSAKTALSDEEVEYKEVQGKLYYINYKIEGSASEFITIATQRPETIMGDTAICVNPNDDRYRHLAGRKAIVPLIDRAVPIIFDEYVDSSFGTGALKVTPAHDINDYNLGLKHKLEVIDTLNADGTLSAAAQIYVGMDRFKARKQIVEELQQKNFLNKEEVYSTRVGYSQRTGVVVEPKISTQWFLDMKQLAGPALEAVTSGAIKIHPGDKFLATYKYWLENVKDWCISRQLWWGQQIPAWYDDAGNCYVASSLHELLQQNTELQGVSLRQDEDVLDTWFSSWLWPMEVFKGITQPGNAEIKYYYPTNVLVTGQDIIFFWVSRMVMAGLEYEHNIPFGDVYFTGMVRDKQGRKMSKSLGNSPDLLDLIDKYGADAVRFGIMISSPAGNDLLFDEASLEQGRNFNNKLWNALKLVKIWEAKIANDEAIAGEQQFAIDWFEAKLETTRAEIQQLIAEFKLSEALKTLYSLIWDDFCSWYLEWVKPGFDQPVAKAVVDNTLKLFTGLLQLLHPFMPFVTEEMYHLLEDRADDLCVRQFAATAQVDESFIEKAGLLQRAITAIRDARNKLQVKPKEQVSVAILSKQRATFETMLPLLSRQVNAREILFTEMPVPDAVAVVAGHEQFFITGDVQRTNPNQREELEKELAHLEKFLDAVEKKLSNENFVQRAKPEVLALERKKREDATAKLEAIRKSLK